MLDALALWLWRHSNRIRSRPRWRRLFLPRAARRANARPDRSV